MEKREEDKEKLVKLALLEQEAKQLEQQLETIEQKILELEVLKFNLDELEKIKLNNEMLSSIGKNVFIKTSLLSKELYVDVGAKTIVKKSIRETREIIDKDIMRLMELRETISKQLENINIEIQDSSTSIEEV